jgi:hypothetical protein
MIDYQTLVFAYIPVQLWYFLFYVDMYLLLGNSEEMDWDKNGTVTFKEFLFAFTRWVGLDDNEDEDDDDIE